MGIGKETVRSKLKKAFEAGFLLGWNLMINPALIGRKSKVVLFDFEGAKRKGSIISQIRLIEGVVLIVDYLDGGLRLLLFYETEEELDRKIKLLSLICDFKNPPDILEPLNPRCDFRVKRTDWEIINKLLKNPRKNFYEIAEELRISSRTVRRRFTIMSEGNAFFLIPKINLKRFHSTSFMYMIRCSNEKTRAKVYDFITSNINGIVYSDSLEKEHLTFAVVRKNISEAEEIQGMIKGLDGVERVEMNVIKEILAVQDWLSEEIEKRIGEAPTPVPLIHNRL